MARKASWKVQAEGEEDSEGCEGIRVNKRRDSGKKDEAREEDVKEGESQEKALS